MRFAAGRCRCVFAQPVSLTRATTVRVPVDAMWFLFEAKLRRGAAEADATRSSSLLCAYILLKATPATTSFLPSNSHNTAASEFRADLVINSPGKPHKRPV